jgi:alpha-L-fucosidase 2
LFEYYEYTLDRDFLKSTAYPIMKKAAMCYLDLLCERGDGFKSVCTTTSPENTFYCMEDGEKKEASVAKYATMTDTIAYELFLNCRKAMDILGADDKEFGAEIDDAISSMKPFSIGSDGRLMEWNEEFEEPEPDHRHISHLYGLHPANLITPDKTPELAEACIKTLKVRGDRGTGWSLGWKINFYARLKNGNRALDLLEMQLNAVDENAVLGQSGTYPNLFDAHPPFQIDGNFALVSGIIEMIVKSQDDELEFLPALPDKWKNGSLKGVRVKGNKIYDIKWADGKLVYAKER